MFLFFDTETTGLPLNYKAPVTDTNNWPRVMQLGYSLHGADRVLIDSGNIYITPPEGGFKIDTKAFEAHGITNEVCQEKGIHIVDALEKFKGMLAGTHYLIAHNLGYDRPVLGCEFVRENLTAPKSYHTICTMLSSVEFCNLPGKYGPKWPKLEELHRVLFNSDFEGAHDALSDVSATAKCFFELVDRGVILLPTPITKP